MVAISLDFTKRNPYKRELTIKQVFNALDQPALIGKDFGRLLHKFTPGGLNSRWACTKTGQRGSGLVHGCIDLLRGKAQGIRQQGR